MPSIPSATRAVALRFAACLLAGLAAFVTTAPVTTGARAGMERGDGRLWLVVASRVSPGDAVRFAQSLRAHVAEAFVAQSHNGRFAIVAGHLDADRAQANLAMLKALRLVPPDSFLSRGENYFGTVWPAPSQIRAQDVVRAPALVSSVVSMQRALARLGLYRSDIDGLIGRGTLGAYRAFERRHGRAGHLVNGWSANQAMAALERRSDPAVLAQNEREQRQRREAVMVARAQALGYRDPSQMEEARERGFEDAATFREAREAGFDRAEAWKDAQEKGFDRASAFREATAGGFDTASAYREARDAGFQEADGWKDARDKGFERATSYRAAMEGGFRDAGEYAAARDAGFRRAAPFREAKEAGFEDRREAEAARAAGYAKADEYRAFKASGFRTPTAWEAARRLGYATRADALGGERAKLVRLRGETRKLLEDAALFVRLQRDPQAALTLAPPIAAVTKAMGDEAADGTLDAITARRARLADASNALAASLQRTPRFEAFRTAQQESRNRELQAALDTERKRIRTLDRGLTLWIADNLLHPKMPQMVVLQQRLAKEDHGTDLAAWRRAAGDAGRSLNKAAIGAEVERLGASANVGNGSAANASSDATADGVAALFTPTDRTRFVIEGPPEGIITLHLARGAPHLARNMRGDFLFTDGKAVLCLPQGLPGSLSERVVRKALAAIPGASSPDGSGIDLALADKCDVDGADASDLVLIERGRFLRGDKALAEALLARIEDGRLRAFEPVDGEALRGAAATEAALVEAIGTDLAERKRTGFVALLLEREGEVCRVGASAATRTDLHDAALQAGVEALDLPAFAAAVSLSAEDAFLGVQRGRCAMVYGATDEVADLAVAMRRDGHGFTVAPFRYAMADHEGTIARERAEAERLALAREENARQRALARREARLERERKARRAAQRKEERQRLAAKREAERKRAQAEREAERKRLAELQREADERERAARDRERVAREERRRIASERRRAEQAERERLAAIKAAEDASLASARTAALRAANDAPAKARLNRVRDLAKAAFGVVDDGANHRLAATHLPDLGRFQGVVEHDRWEHRSLTLTVEEFGDALWDGRKVEALVARIEPRIVNADLGQYRTPCFRVALLFDDEFDRLRGTREMECGDDAGMREWAQAHGLQSRWTVRPKEVAAN